MFGKVDGQIHTYFADSPVVISISGLQWPGTSPFNIVRVEVVYLKKDAGGTVTDMITVGDFHEDTGGQSVASFDISAALQAIWSGYEYGSEVAQATAALTGSVPRPCERAMREYVLRIYTEYLAGDDGGVFTVTQCSSVIDGVEYRDIPGGQCLMGGMTEWERSLVGDPADADVASLEHSGPRYGDGSTKPTGSPERVGQDSITSWVDVTRGYTKSIFYPAPTSVALPAPTGDGDDPRPTEDAWEGHAPLVLRDSQPYVDFLFTNRRGAVESCSAVTLDSLGVSGDMKQYSRTDGPSFSPARSLMAFGTDGRRSWQMSSGYVTREWADWWAMEFLNGRRKQWWMRYRYTRNGTAGEKFVPVTVKAARSDVTVYDRTKQQPAHVDFTVTLGLEG